MKKTLPDLLDYNLDYVIVRFFIHLFPAGTENCGMDLTSKTSAVLLSDWYQPRTDGSLHWTVVSRSWKSFL